MTSRYDGSGPDSGISPINAGALHAVRAADNKSAAQAACRKDLRLPSCSFGLKSQIPRPSGPRVKVSDEVITLMLPWRPVGSATEPQNRPNLCSSLWRWQGQRVIDYRFDEGVYLCADVGAVAIRPDRCSLLDVL